jgi:hypothetical protein
MPAPPPAAMQSSTAPGSHKETSGKALYTSIDQTVDQLRAVGRRSSARGYQRCRQSPPVFSAVWA